MGMVVDQPAAPAAATRDGRHDGHHAVIDQLVADGIPFLFGNPGTVEQGLLDALSEYSEPRYVLTLQESVAVMIANGYARATRKPAAVHLHSTPGLGNAIGALYHAMMDHAPLVVIGGDAGVMYQGLEAHMSGDLVGFARPVTKWSTMVLDPASLLRVLRRAIKIAATPPTGPVYVCLPQDVLDAPAHEEVHPTSLLSTRVVPEDATLREVALILANAQKPMIFVGDGVAWSGAQDELTRVAELLGAEVWEVDSGEANMNFAHPLHKGMMGHMSGQHSLPITSRGDVNLVCGTYLVPEVFPALGPVFAPGAKVIHIDLAAGAMAKNQPVDVGLVSDPRLTLAGIGHTLAEIMTPEQRALAAARTRDLTSAKQAARTSAGEQDRVVRDSVPLHFSRFMEELARRLPEDAIVYDEALTNSEPITRYWQSTLPGHYFYTRGGSLGVALPAAIGMKLAHPDKTVFGIGGDGGAMYTIQALWSAARHNVGAKFVVCNNGSYRLLQVNIEAYWQQRGIPLHAFPLAFDLSEPVLRFDQIARALSVPGVRVEQPGEIGPAIDQALAHDGPFLIDVVLEGDVQPEMISIRCGQ